MNKNSSFYIMDYLRLPVIISIILLIAGIILAVYSNEIAWMLIGISVSLLGAFQLFSNITTIREDIEKTNTNKYPYQKNNYNKTKLNNEIENSVFENDKEDDFIVVKKVKSETKKDGVSEDIDKKYIDDESEYVRIKGKIKTQNNFDKKNEGIESDDSENNQTSDPNIRKNDNTEENNNNSNDDGNLDTVKYVTSSDKTNVIEKIIDTDEQHNVIDSNKREFNKNYKRTKISMESIKELIKNDNINDLKLKSELEYMLSKLLVILSSITDTKTAVFAVTDTASKEYVIESYVTTVPEKILKKERFSFGDDLISQIINNKQHEILDSINPDAETDLISYYKEKTGTKSFIGTPIFYDDKVIGVLCIDSNTNKAYDDSVVNLLADFKNLCASLISNYNDKYILNNDKNILKSIESFNNLFQKVPETEDNIIDALINATSEVFDFDRIGICGYNEKDNNWNIIAINNDDNSELGIVADTSDSLISKTLNKYEPVYATLTKDTKVRIHENEPHFEKGFFVSVPIRSKTSNYGALFAEYSKGKYLTESDITALLKISEFAALTVEKLNLTDMLNNSSIIDRHSGLHNNSAFVQRLQEEMTRANDFKYKASLALLKVDKYSSYDKHPDKQDKIISHFLSNIEKNIRVYDILGQLENEIFAVLLIEKDSSSAQFWAEKVRTSIANSMFEINSQRFSVTASIGLSEMKDNMKPIDIINNAREALSLSLNKSNSVTMY